MNRQQRRQYYRKNKWARLAKKSALDKMMDDYAAAASQRWAKSAEKKQRDKEEAVSLVEN